MAWKMNREEYLELKSLGWKDDLVARKKGISIRTLDRWKKEEGIRSELNRRNKRELA